jgi:hypothetical protein
MLLNTIFVKEVGSSPPTHTFVFFVKEVGPPPPSSPHTHMLTCSMRLILKTTSIGRREMRLLGT